MLDSYRRWTGRELIARSGDPVVDAKVLFEAPFVIVSHGTQKNPILNYGNQTALNLWEIDWAHLTKMPSRETAEPMHREERELFMTRVKRDGFVTGYEGIRISKSGKRFRIEDALIWNIIDEKGSVCGQAATFSKWRPVV